jgi:hypothetical protein
MPLTFYLPRASITIAHSEAGMSKLPDMMYQPVGLQ